MNQNKVLISIIVVTYNAGRLIRGVLDSLKNRISQNTEVIIMDGQSTDDTVQIAETYACISKIISENDSGIYDAMNKGVKNATGKFILFLGADDKLLININLVEALLEDDDAIYYGNVLKTPVNEIYYGEFDKIKLINRNICHQSMFYPRQLLLQQPYDLRYKLMADYVLNMQLWSAKVKFNYIDLVIAEYSTEGASSINVDIEFKKDAFKLVYRLFGVWGVVLKCFNPVKNALKNKLNFTVPKIL